MFKYSMQVSKINDVHTSETICKNFSDNTVLAITSANNAGLQRRPE